MVLNNLRMALTGDPVSIRVTMDRIAEVLPSRFETWPDKLELDLDGAMVFPGLVNSHDHLDFNVFPALGDRTYNNYTEWGRYLHTNYRESINKVLAIPIALREQWGIYKNLLNGVTTVINHGKKIKKTNSPISIYENCQSIHSVGFEKKWWLSLNNPFKKNMPVAIHIGEGTDSSSKKEIDTLLKRNFLKRSMIGIHGVAMSVQQADSFKALVWCPDSNDFLLNATAPINCLKKHVHILFGTDSTLTSNWNIWQHIRRARETQYLTDKELLNTLTLNAAKAWGLGCGEIAPYKSADLVIAKNKGNDHDAFFNLNPEDILIVISKGAVRLFDGELYEQLKYSAPANYSKVYIKRRCKYVAGDLPLLVQNIKQYYPEANFPVM